MKKNKILCTFWLVAFLLLLSLELIQIIGWNGLFTLIIDYCYNCHSEAAVGIILFGLPAAAIYWVFWTAISSSCLSMFVKKYFQFKYFYPIPLIINNKTKKMIYTKISKFYSRIYIYFFMFFLQIILLINTFIDYSLRNQLFLYYKVVSEDSEKVLYKFIVFIAIFGGLLLFALIKLVRGIITNKKDIIECLDKSAKKIEIDKAALRKKPVFSKATIHSKMGGIKISLEIDISDNQQNRENGFLGFLPGYVDLIESDIFFEMLILFKNKAILSEIRNVSSIIGLSFKDDNHVAIAYKSLNSLEKTMIIKYKDIKLFYWLGKDDYCSL